MQLLNWSRSFLLRRRRHRERAARREQFAPVRLSLRRLEERRVLDVSAAFMNGVLEVDITSTTATPNDTATIGNSGTPDETVVIQDAEGNDVDIVVEGMGPMPVAWADVNQVVVRGDTTGSQTVVFDTSLLLANGLQVDDEIELAVLTDTITSGESIEFGSDVILDSEGTNDVTLVGTNLTFGGTLDSQLNTSHNLTINVGMGSVSFNGDIGATGPLDGLDIQQADGGVTFGDAEPVNLIRTNGPISIGSDSPIAGGITLNGGSNVLMIDTLAGNVDLNGPVELQSDVLVSTEAGGGDLILHATSTIDSQPNETNNLVLMLGTGNASLGAPVGMVASLGELRIVSAMDVTAQADVNAARIVQESGSGTTTFGGAINTTDIDLTGHGFVFDGPVAATGDGRVTIVHSGLLDINASAEMRLDGAFEESGGGSVELAGDIITSGAPIHFGSPVTLTDGAAAGVLLDTTDDKNDDAGAAIVFNGTVDALNAEVETLTLNAGTSGNISFISAIGNAGRVGQLQIVNAHDVTWHDSLTATNVVQDSGNGTTTFGGTVDLNAANAPSIDVSTVNVFFLAPVSTSGDGRVTLTVSGVLDLGAAADMTLNGSFFQDGEGLVRTSADIQTSDDDIAFTGEVLAREPLRFDTGSGAGNLVFVNTLNGTIACQQDITLALGTGNALFQDAVGGVVGLGDIVIEDAAHVRFASSLVASSLVQTAGSGETRFDGPVTIKTATGVDLTTGSVTINNTFDTSTVAGPVRIATSDDITINGAVTAGNATVELLADDDIFFGGSGAITTTGSSVTVRADADGSANGIGGAVLMSDGAIIDAGSGVIDIAADENIQLGRLLTTNLVRLTSTSGAIVDGGDTDGPDIVAETLAIRTSTGVGTANPIDTSVNTIAVENRGEGGVRLDNVTRNALTIGSVDGLSGIMNGPIGAPENLVGDVEIIHNGAIHVTAPILNHAGSHTTVRAEGQGDLTIDAPIQNRGGDGWIFLFSGGDLTINHSVRELEPEPEAEISVENEGAIRGQADGLVSIDNSTQDYVIIRTGSGQATNFPPIFDIEPVDQGGSNVDSNGRAIVKITIGDAAHLEMNWHFTIDWGDGNIESYPIPRTPESSRRFLNAEGETVSQIDSGVDGEPGVYYVSHEYLGPPNPADPSAPIPISATLRYDARETGDSSLDRGLPPHGSSIFNGIRFFQNGAEPIFSADQAVLTIPGEGSFFFIKVIESVIVPVESRRIPTVFVPTNSTATTDTTGLKFEFLAASFEAETFEEYRLFMRMVDDVAARAQQAESGERSMTAGEVGPEYPLPLELLDDPLSLFRERQTEGRQFPNGHYRIYLEEVRTGRVRLILDVHIYEGRVVPENFREGTGERQPGSDDTSRIESVSEPPAIRGFRGLEDSTPATASPSSDETRVEPNDPPDIDASDEKGLPRQSDWMLPVAASTLPWRARVRRALQSEERAISRLSLRLRRHRRVE